LSIKAGAAMIVPMQCRILCRQLFQIGREIRPNQSMQPMAPARETVSAFATNPAHG
jgi:hypothetical protein